MPFRDTLARLRSQSIIGREPERDAFEALLHADGPLVMLVDGPSGVGKSTLLHACADRAAETGTTPLLLDLSGATATPTGFLERLHSQTPLRFDGHMLARTDTSGAPFVLLLDTFEDVLAIAPWLRDTLLPALPDEARLVVAGQTVPGADWRADPALGALLVSCTLGPLDDDHARALLARRGIVGEAQAPILAFAHGHPLALALAADTLGATSPSSAGPAAPTPAFDPQGADLIGALLDRFVRVVPDAKAQMALYAASLVLYLDEGLLGEMLDRDRARAQFDWLRTLSFVATAPRGLTLHALVRQLLVHDVQWRDPDLYRTLHRRARQHYSRRLTDGDPARQVAWLSDYLFLYRENPVVAPLFARLQAQWTGRVLSSGPARPDEHDALAEMVERHEGHDAAEVLRRGLAHDPATARVYRDHAGHATGLLASTFFTADDPPAETAARHDPALVPAQAFLRSAAPLRAGERALYFRFWMDADAYQSVSPVQSLVFVDTVRAYLSTPGLAYSFLPVADPAPWSLIFTLVGLERLPEADFVQDGKTFAVFGHDWRRVPPSDWLEGLARFGLTGASDSPRAPTRAVLTRDVFGEAVRDALRSAVRSDVLRQNPLVRTRLVATRAEESGEAPEAVLLALMRRAAEALNTGPRAQKMYRALHATYFSPALSQERAAEDLDVPFSSYRRHLRAGIEAVIEALWQQELGGGAVL